MISPRWQKVIADLWSNKVRSLLVILSISVGVFSVGYVSTCFPMLLEDMNAAFRSVNAHSAVIYMEPFDDDLVEIVRSISGVGYAEGHSTTYSKILVSPEKTVSIQIFSIPPLDEMKIDSIHVENGSEPLLGDYQIYLERTSQEVLKVKRGDVITLELMDGHTRKLTVAGLVHDVSNAPFVFSNQAIGYVTPDTIEWLGGSRRYDQLYITVSENQTDTEYVTSVSKVVSDKIEKGGYKVYETYVYNPGKHWASDITQALAQITGVLGALAVFLSAFLVTNTIHSMLGQHIRQIGMMKAVGGKTTQLIVMYLVLVMSYGMVALIITIPLSALISYSTSIWISEFLNFDLRGFRFIPSSVALQIAIALLVPFGAALVPVIKGTGITIREAISSYGLGKGKFGTNIIDRLLEKIQFLTRPLSISLRNAFRRKARLFLTLSTLILAGSIFIAVFNVKSSLDLAIENVKGYFLSDVNISFGNIYRLQKLQAIAMSVPGVVAAEGWGFLSVDVLSPTGDSSIQAYIAAPPSDSELINPTMTKGRWLMPGDENALVIGNHLIKARPDLDVGDVITLEIDNKKSPWHIVGIYQLVGNVSPPLVYVNYEYFSRFVNDIDRVGSLRITTVMHDGNSQEQIARILSNKYKDAGIPVADIVTGTQFSLSQTSTTDILVYILLIMSILIALVGGLGLMGTMGMNVLERTREIGVMRAIGASDKSILQLVIVEGMLIGTISWILGLVFSIPITMLLTTVIGMSMLSAPMTPVFSAQGMMVWLIGMLVIAAISSALPARNASRLTVREVLSYE